MAALSEQLIHVHQALRDRLAALRQEAARQQAAVGTGSNAADTALPETTAVPEKTGLPKDLLSHCLSFCTAILESHFSYEERRIAKALDILGAQAWTADVFTMARRLSGAAAGQMAGRASWSEATLAALAPQAPVARRPS